MTWSPDDLRELLTQSYPSALTSPETTEYYEVYTVGGVEDVEDRALAYSLLDSRPYKGSLAFAPPDELQRRWESHELDGLSYRNEYVRFLRDSFRQYREMWDAFYYIPRLVIACSCKDGEICHRDLLAEAFVKLHLREGVDASYMGDVPGDRLPTLHSATQSGSGSTSTGDSGAGHHGDDWE